MKKENKMFEAFGKIDESYLAAAEESLHAPIIAPKRTRAWWRAALVAACLTLVIAAIPIGIMIASNPASPSVPVITPTTTNAPDSLPGGIVTTPHESSSNNVVIPTPNTTINIPITTAPQMPTTTQKPSPLLAIPGAEILKDTSVLQNNNYGLAPVFRPEEDRVALVKSQTAFTGTVIEQSSVIVYDNATDKNWFLTLLTIEVDEAFGSMDKDIEEITVITASRYSSTFRASGTNASFGDIALLAQEDPYGLYVIEPANDHPLKINGETINLSEYADYYLFLRYDCDGEKYGYTFRGHHYYLPVSLDKLRD